MVEANSAGSLCARDLEPAAVAAQKSEGAHMAPEGAGPMMVLAVNVIGDGAAKRHETGSRRRWQEPAFGNGEAKDFGKADAGVGAQHALDRIEVNDAIELRHVDQIAIPVETGIAVGAPQTRRKQARISCCVHEGRERSRKRGVATCCGSRTIRPQDVMSLRVTKGSLTFGLS